MPADLPSLTFANAELWRQWLAREGSTTNGIWLTLAKKGTTAPTSLKYSQALDEALCYGWIDGQARKGDDKTYSQRFTPRAAKSSWSKRNVGHIARLEAEDRMRDAGREAVEKAKADGRWDAAYAGSADAEVSEDFLAVLGEVPSAMKTWEGMNKTSRYVVYLRLKSLKTIAGREKRIKAFVEMLARGEVPGVQKGGQRQVKSMAKAREVVEGRSMRQTRSGRGMPGKD